MERKTREVLDTLAKTLTTPIEETRALPPAAYTSEEVLDLEKEHIFRKEWLCIGREEQVAKPGDYLARDLVGEPVVVVRDAKGELHAFSNVCRHRYMQLVEGQGSTDKFVCPYHGWTYQLDGALAGAPHMNESRIFERRNCHLPEFRVETWLGFVLVNFDPDAAPLGPQHEAAAERLASLRLGEMRMVATIDEVWDGNWKLGVENGSENYHVPRLHAPTFGSWIDLGVTESELYDGREVGSWLFSDMQMDHVSEEAPEFAELIGRAAAGMPEPDAGRFTGYNLHPALIMDSFPGNCVWSVWLPIDATHTRQFGGVLVHPSEIEAGGDAFCAEHQAWTDKLNAEDYEATWRLQGGLRSRYSDPGPLSYAEGCVYYLQRFLAERLT